MDNTMGEKVVEEQRKYCYYALILAILRPDLYSEDAIKEMGLRIDGRRERRK